MESWVSNIVNGILSVLPRSPFREFIDSFEAPEYLGFLNWFIPVNTIVKILGLWLLAVALFYLYSVIMRWTKLIGG